MKRVSALVLVIAALGLQGCVLAAAAIPVLAGGALVGRGALGDRTRQAIAEGTDIDPASIGNRQFGDYAIVPGGVLPAPVAPLPTGGPYGELAQFATSVIAEAQAEEGSDEQSGPRQSALLVDPAELEAERLPCSADVPALLVDLDPADGMLPIEGASAPDQPFVTVLEELRRRGVAIVWMTDREPTDAGRIRTLLREYRLDPTGRDPLFVQRFPGERKQARRRALLETHCVIAMAGDERADFDELYTYLRDPIYAAELEALIGEAWFIIPTPLD